MEQPGTAFVLAGGGSYGAVQVGMLRALFVAGITPDLVAGSSVGAINGTFFAGEPNLEGIERLAAVWRRLRRRDVFPLEFSLFARLGRSDHLFEPDGLRRLVAAHLPCARLEDSPVPMHVMATDLLSGMAVRLSTGPAVEAVLASCAIPAIYPPVWIGGRRLIDGAVASNTPIRAAIELGAKRVIVLPTAFACPHAAPPRGIFANAFHAMDLVVMQQLSHERELYGGDAQIVTVPPICPLAVPPYDFSHVDRLIDAAAAATGAWLEGAGMDAGKTSGHTCVRVRGPASTRSGEPCGVQLPSCPKPRES